MPKGGGKVRKRQDSASSGAGDGGNNGESASNHSAKNSSSTNGDVREGSPEKGCCHPVNCSCDDPLDLSKNAVKVICSNEGCPESSYMHDRCFDKWEDSVLDHLSCAPRIVTGRFLRWPKEKRRESLWTIRGYDLVKKAHVEVCKCRCGKGYLRKDTEWRPEEDTTAKKKKQKKGGSSQQQEQQQQHKQQHKQQQQKEQQQQQQKEQQPPTQQQQVKQAKPTLNHPVVKWPAPYMLPISERSTPPIPEHYIPGLNFEEQNGQKKKKKKKRSKSGKSETSSQNSESKPPTPDDLESQDVEETVETVDKEEGVVEQLVELGFSRQASEEAVQIHGSMEEALDSLLKSSSSKTNGDNKIVDKELSTVVAPPRKVDSNGNLTVPYPVQELMSLGFSREDSEAALRIHESLGSAVEYLMAQRQSARYRNNPLGNGFVASQPLAPTPFTPRPLDQFFPQNGPAFPQQQLFLQQNVEVPISQIPTPYSNPTSQLFPSLPPGFLQHQVPTPPQPPPSVPSIDDHVPLEAPAVKTNDKTDMSHAMQRLMDMGFSYRQSEAAFKQHGHLDSALDALISGEFDDFNWETQPKRNANKTDPFTNKVLIENSSSEADTTHQGGTFPSWHPMQSQNFISSLDTFSLPSKVPIGTPASDKQGMPEDPITAISVKVLTDMGFTSEQSYKAIKEHGTVEAALNSLITSAFNQSGSLDTEVYMSDEEDFPESLSPPKLNHSRSAFQPVAPRATQVGPRLTKSAMFPSAATAQVPVSLPKQQPTFSMRASVPVAARPAAPKVVAMNGHHGKAPGATPTPCAALWVGNVTAKVSQADLQTIFGKYGRILSIKIMHAKTCAFVNFTNMADATRARDGLQGTEIGGMELVIRFPDNPIINADGNFLMMKSKLKTGNQTGGQSAAKVSQSQSSYQQGKMKGPVETEFGEECFFYRTTGCHFGKNCSYLHISHHKGVDL